MNPTSFSLPNNLIWWYTLATKLLKNKAEHKRGRPVTVRMKYDPTDIGNGKWTMTIVINMGMATSTLFQHTKWIKYQFFKNVLTQEDHFLFRWPIIKWYPHFILKSWVVPHRRKAEINYVCVHDKLESCLCPSHSPRKCLFEILPHFKSSYFGHS